MRIESAVTSISWIPSEAVEGMTRVPFEMGVAHYDEAPPDVIDDIEALRQADRFRFANQLKAWIEVEDGRITGHGYTGGGLIGSTTMSFGPRKLTFAAVSFPDRQHDPVVGDTWVRFVQTAGGRTGVPAPRKVKYPPFLQINAPLAWTTLALTIKVDGSSSHEVLGASPFPRHWIYDKDNNLAQKSGLINFKSWYERAFGAHTPWGDEDSPALVTQVETALERELSSHIMRGNTEPTIRKVGSGRALMEEGQPGTELFLLLDGVMSVEAQGKALAHVGPGAVLGERALLESGRRTATVRAVTQCRVAVVPGDQLDPDVLASLAGQHRREES